MAARREERGQVALHVGGSSDKYFTSTAVVAVTSLDGVQSCATATLKAVLLKRGTLTAVCRSFRVYDSQKEGVPPEGVFEKKRLLAFNSALQGGSAELAIE